MNRPSFENICTQIANLISERSTCSRLKVGAVIVSEDYTQIYSWGYNGNAKGLPNKCDSKEPGKCGCIHAEANAIINCTVAKETPKVVFCTTSPCMMCAKMLINLGGVKEIYYQNQYRTEFKKIWDILYESGIILRKTN